MLKKKQNTFFNMKASDDGKSADVFIYGEITKYAWEEYGEVSSITFKDELEALGDDVELINLYINSPGGSVFEAMAIMAMLQRHPAKIISHVDGLAASCASVIPMISDEIRMPANSLMMIHQAWTFAWGNADELRKAADDIERVNKSMVQYYLDRAGDKLSEDTLSEMLKEDTWLTADEAYQYGLCDVVEVTNQAVAFAFGDEWAQKYNNVPKQLKENQTNELNATEMAERQRIADEAKQNQKTLELILGGL